MSGIELLLLLLAAAIVGAAVIVVLRFEAARRAEQGRLQSEVRAEREARSAQLSELARAQERLEAREAENRLLQDRLREADAQHEALGDQLRQLQEAKARAEAELAQSRAHLEHGARANREMKQFLEQAQEKLSGAFAELAGKTFSETVSESAARSRSDLEMLLKPFAERIGEFRKRVDVLYAEEARERAALAGAVVELKTLNQDMATRAHELTRALRGNAKVRGDWGELMLESVLRGSGLQEGEHFERQATTSDDEGRVLRPDIIVRLPDERRIVVDSKVNLVAWQEAMNTDLPEEQEDAMRRHAVALRQHVKDLAERDYPRALGDSVLEVTILFVPIEGALSAALGSDDGLQSFAFERRIVLASPNTLMAILRVVDRVWMRDRIQKQALEISKSGGLLLDAVNGFLSDFDDVDKRMKQARDAYDSARRRLQESPQSVVARARRLEEMGARGKRSLSAGGATEPALPAGEPPAADPAANQ